MLQLADFKTKTGLFHSEAYNLIELYETIVKENSLLKTTSGFVFDIIILNRDITSHISDTLKNEKQEIIPSYCMVSIVDRNLSILKFIKISIRIL